MPRKKTRDKTPHPIRIDNADWKKLCQEAERQTEESSEIVYPSELVRSAVRHFVEQLPGAKK